jgi:hypothetical protein
MTNFNENLKNIIEKLQGATLSLSDSCSVKNLNELMLKDKTHAISAIIELVKGILPESKPINPNAGHCLQCGLSTNSFNNGYNVYHREILNKLEE